MNIFSLITYYYINNTCHLLVTWEMLLLNLILKMVYKNMLWHFNDIPKNILLLIFLQFFFQTTFQLYF